MQYLILYLLFFIVTPIYSQNLIPVGKGWAGNSVNTVVFRKNSIVSYKDLQYASYYDSSGHVVIAKRKLNSNKWLIKQTPLKGNIKDAHNSISIMVDGDGFVHIAWDHHGNQLHYTKSIQPGSVEFAEEQSMTGKDEQKVTYPEFYKLANGDLLFLYRDGSSGRGNLILNRYYTKTKKWERINSNLLNGEGHRNAYWQACTDNKGSFHISWVWRESPDVYTNHDLCYARSDDGGKTWKQSTGREYQLPITAANAEYIVRIPQGSELINSTAMSANDDGNPYIATYWSDSSKIPQYRLVFFDGKKWNVRQVSNRTTSFVLSGAGTKKIPIARPQVLVKGQNVFIIFRDEERGNKVSVFINDDTKLTKWTARDLTNIPVGQWEPSFDTELWRTKKILDLFVQYTGQGDGERTENINSQMVNILHWDMSTNKK